MAKVGKNESVAVKWSRIAQLSDLPMQRGEQSIGTHDDGTVRELIFALADTFEIVSSRICLTNCTRCQVHDLVPVVADICVQLGHTKMSPVSAYCCKDVTQCIGPNST